MFVRMGFCRCLWSSRFGAAFVRAKGMGLSLRMMTMMMMMIGMTMTIRPLSLNLGLKMDWCASDPLYIWVGKLVYGVDL